MKQTSRSGWTVRFLDQVGLRRCATVFALVAAFAACSGGGDPPVAEPIPAAVQQAADDGWLTARYVQSTQQLTLTWVDRFSNETGFVVETLVADTWKELAQVATSPDPPLPNTAPPTWSRELKWTGTIAPGTAVRVQALVDRWKVPLATVARRTQIDLPPTAYSIVLDSTPPLAGTVRLSLAGGAATRVRYGSDPSTGWSFGNYAYVVAVTWATVVVENGVYTLSAEVTVNEDLTIHVDHPQPVEVRNPPLTLGGTYADSWDGARVSVALLAAGAYGIDTVRLWIDGQLFAGLPTEKGSCGVTYQGICQAPHTFEFDVPGALLPDGNHTFRFVVTGTRGDTAELEKVIAIDKPPLLTLVSPVDNAVVGNSLHIQGSSIDDGGPSEVEISIDGQFIRRIPGGAFDLTLDISALQPGSHELFLWANDVGDHRSWAYARFTK